VNGAANREAKPATPLVAADQKSPRPVLFDSLRCVHVALRRRLLVRGRNILSLRRDTSRVQTRETSLTPRGKAAWGIAAAGRYRADGAQSAV